MPYFALISRIFPPSPGEVRTVSPCPLFRQLSSSVRTTCAGLQCPFIAHSNKATEALANDDYITALCDGEYYFEADKLSSMSLKCFASKTVDGWALQWIRNGYAYQPSCRSMSHSYRVWMLGWSSICLPKFPGHIY